MAASKKATLTILLSGFSRDRLKQLCRDLGLDDSGEEKAVLVDHLTGSKASTPPPAPKRANGAKAAPEPTDLDPSTRLTKARLKELGPRLVW